MFSLAKYRKLIRKASFLVAVFFFFNFKIRPDLMFMSCEVLFTLYTFFLFALLQSKSFEYIYEPPIFFIVFCLVYEFLKFPYYFGYVDINRFISSIDLQSQLRVENYYEVSVTLLLFQFAAIIILVSTYKLFRKKAEKKFIECDYVRGETLLILLIIFFLLVGYWGLYKITDGNLFFLLSRRSGNSDAGDLLKDNYVISLASTMVLVIIPLLIGMRLFSQKRWKLLLFFFFPAILLSYLITGARGYSIFSVLATVFFIVLKSEQIRLIQLGVFAVFVAISFSFLGVVRRTSNESENFLRNIRSSQQMDGNWYYEISNYQLQLRDEMVFAKADNTDLLLGRSYFNLLTFPLPKKILGNLKPEFIDATVAKTFWNRKDLGLPLNAMGESYFNFGLLGLFVFLAVGRLMAGIANFLDRRGSIINICLAVVICIFAQTWSTTYLTYASQYIFILFLPLLYVRRASRKQSIGPQKLAYAN